MRGVAFALIASSALSISALTSSPAAAGCYGDGCDGYYGPKHYHYAPTKYERYERYVGRPYYRSYRGDHHYHHHDRPRYHTTYYRRGPEYYVSHGNGYHNGYYHNGYCGNGYCGNGYYGNGYYVNGHYNGYYVNGGPYYHRRYVYPTVRYGGAWLQTAAYGYGYGYPYYGGCHTAYVPYGWTWYKTYSC